VARRYGRRSHAGAPRNFWLTPHRAAPMAHVLCAVHCRGVYLPGAAAPVSCIHAQDRHAGFPECPATAVDDFLADPSSRHEPRQEKAASDGRLRAVTVRALKTETETNLLRRNEQRRLAALSRPLAFVARDDAVLDVDDPVSVLRDISFVGDQNDGIALGVQPVKQRHDLNAGL